MTKRTQSITALPKSPTGIRGLDEITNGGLPRGRPTLICGPAGCGKTLLSMEFLVHGAREYGENGILILPLTSMNLQHKVSTERISNVESEGSARARMNLWT